MAWEPDYKAEYERRIRLIMALREDEALREKVMVHYARNPWDWIEDFAITYDPRAKVKTPPFLLFPKQRELVYFLSECVRDSEPGLIEKCRDAGATWICCCFAVWQWIFVKGSAAGFGSRDIDLVDKLGDPSSIFEKMRILIANLPSFMRPAYDAPLMKIVNHGSGSSIIGEGGPNIGRGGRTTVFFKDESAHYKQAESIEASLSGNTEVQIDISSVNGSANIFYRKRMAGEVWAPGRVMTPGKTRVFIFDWRDDLRKSQQWYDLRRQRYENDGLLHIFAQEVDRDYTGSTERIIIPQVWVRAAIDAHIKLGFEPTGEKVAGQDIADGGGDKNSFVARYGVVMVEAQHWGGEAGDAARKTMPLCAELGITELGYDSVGVGSGFKEAVNQMAKGGLVPTGLKITPWNGGASVQNPKKHIVPADKTSPLNEDQYLNLKAQSWFLLRSRFYKTFRAVTKGETYPVDELISLSSKMENLHQLCMELSQPVYTENGAGKTMVDKKPNGAMSPNLGDGAVICYNPVRKAAGFFDLPAPP